VTDEPRPVSSEVAELGEGARWDAAHQQLIWVDIMAGVLRRSVEDGAGIATVEEITIGEPLGAVAPVEAGGWLLAAGRGLRHLTADGAVVRLVDTEVEGVRMNDAACDPQGRFWTGSMAAHPNGADQHPGGGRLLRCDPDGVGGLRRAAAGRPAGRRAGVRGGRRRRRRAAGPAVPGETPGITLIFGARRKARFGGMEPNPSTQLVRPRKGRIFAGVCAGLALRFGWSPTVVRVLFLVSCILPGPQFIAYVVLWLVIPSE
jgi:phage shock protein PspC (stress-responsive transcriptional regulator)